MQGTPGARGDFSRLGSSGKIEKSTVIYDQAGKQKFRVDYSDHGNAKHHPNPPHLHEYTYQDAGKSIKHKYVYMLDPSTGRMRKSEIDKETNEIKFID
ncbi:hypothetical protein [Priestia megaterium]|uniref:hypothetical protein n=1 Tax=Priestia megaterium TaxID=1404 RepID=UPI000BF4AB13|nr:hypothetical protein [Priestia megaterium]MDC7769747.1 hypothetical protein [Priestia megaterium]PEU68447.1 hypothetical protein CN397_18715 [Priestia megaterium]PGR06945.1 hypothetical protein COA23_10710 [Priestia megaterium]UYT86198.1 hypothetical protein OHU75_01165 [Priestia megaterium]